ncbi:MAG: type 4a pilus biogenesis protein PilO [Patescibacteria group bacterium]
MTLRVNKTFYLAVAIILVIVGSIVFVFIPYQEKNEEILATLNEKRVDLTLLKEQVQKIDTTDITSELTQAENQLNSFLIDKTEILQFISTLEGIAEKHSLEITIDLDEFPDDNTSPVIEQPISIKVDGGYANIIGFVAELESQEYYLSFQQLNVTVTTSPVSNKTNSTTLPPPTGQTLQLTLGGNSYWR